jgi:CheY-like chemotaxis protein
MDEETLRRATEPFFTTKGVGKGTGLGLAMVYGLAEQSGGRFSLKSELGRGTTAEMLLPVAACISQVPVAAEPNESPAPPVASTGAGGLTVLVVDDDGLVLRGTAAMVEDMGHSAVEAGSGPEALAILRSGQSIDVVVTDHAMPGMTGAQLAATLRLKFPALPVILASGYAELPPEVDDLIVARLHKPFLEQDLAKALSRTGKRGDKVVPLRVQRT